jgi:Ca2+-binding RTX toxin-like protein
MKKSYSLSDEAGAFPSFNDGSGAPAPAPAAANDGLIFDDGEPFAQLDAAGSISVSAGSAKPVVAISTLADYLVNGFWQYNNTVAHHWASNTISYNISGLNAAEQFLAQTALQAWHEVANVNFVQTTGTANITFSDAGTMQAVTGGSWYSNGAMASANVDISSDWIANDGGAMDGKTGIDSYGYQSYIHEIGHALGLGHQGPYNGSAVYSTDALYADDTWQYSIMSYFSQNNFSGGTYRYVVSPQIADVYAVDSIYGAATTTRTGDTVYGFHSNAGAVFDFNAYTRASALTIYDSGGNDTLDCSGYSAAQTIDLHAGAFSSVGGLVNNIAIASNTTIENAIGGSGNDTLIANDNGCTLSGGAGNDSLIGGAGNDRLIGGAGVDTMTGGGGADTFVFAAGDSSAASGQHDRITDFIVGTDHIDLSGIDAIAGTAGVDLFRFIATAAFDGTAGELDYSYNSALGVTIVQGDTNGDRVTDFAIDLVGNLTLSLSNFIGAYSSFMLVTPTTARAVQGGAAVGVLNGAATIVDATSTTLSGATIKVSAAAGNIFPGDELFINGAQSGVVDGGRVTVSWNDSTKVLTLTGVASITDYQTLLSEISYQWTGIDSSSGSHTPHTVTWSVNDGMGNLSTTSVITIERAPVAAVANVVLNPNAATVAASSFLTASDPDGDAIAIYAFKDTGNGHFLLNGVAQPNNQEIDVSMAQLSLLTYQSLGGTDSVQARVSDGTLWSSWQPFTITGPISTVVESFGLTRACPQLEDSQAVYRVIHKRSADSELTRCVATPFGTINGTGSRIFCPDVQGMWA